MIQKAELLHLIQDLRPHIPVSKNASLMRLIEVLNQLHKEAYPKPTDFPERMKWNLKDMQPGEQKKFPLSLMASAQQAVFQAKRKYPTMRFQIKTINARTAVITCRTDVVEE